MWRGRNLPAAPAIFRINSHPWTRVQQQHNRAGCTGTLEQRVTEDQRVHLNLSGSRVPYLRSSPFFILFFLFWTDTDLLQVGYGTSYRDDMEPHRKSADVRYIPPHRGYGSVTIGAMSSLPLGIGSALYISELARPGKGCSEPAIELLAGIPLGGLRVLRLIVLTDWIRVTFDVPPGRPGWRLDSARHHGAANDHQRLRGRDLMLSAEYKEGSLAVGANHWQTISRVIVPGALRDHRGHHPWYGAGARGDHGGVMVTGNAAIIPSRSGTYFRPSGP